MICDICGKEGANIRHVNRNYGKVTDIFIIVNVPVVDCPHCKQKYLTADTLYEIEWIKLNRKSIAEKRSILVAGFSNASSQSEALIRR
jgi:YgiT-type zinc finger domain-containing protein